MHTMQYTSIFTSTMYMFIQESWTYDFESAFISKIKSQCQLLGIQRQMKIYNMSPLHLCMMFLSNYQDVPGYVIGLYDHSLFSGWKI